MATFKEIKVAKNILVKNGCHPKNITILQCTTDYPCKISDVNLLVIPKLKSYLDATLGFLITQLILKLVALLQH